MKVFKALWHLFALVGLAVTAGALWFFQQGITTRAPPTSVEVSVARAARVAMIPAAARRRRNPGPDTEETLRAGLEHFADHCASCHANDGSGDTEMGRNLFPKAPDMRLPATQSLTDGELFWIIEHGVRFTGMPGWSTGTKEGEAASWHLVHFVRHLPDITEAELEDMAERNPRSREEVRQDVEAERFLRGEDVR